ncbi:WW domain binding protein VOPP1-like [Liolophura sinensis]|uniref:WW domain binding protein VOPP1-like n=1 Tax=Liolophura sinensis TaxID=3198878 RepID=UPI0031591AE1
MEMVQRGYSHLKQSAFLLFVFLLRTVDSRYCWHIFHGHTQYFYCGVHQTCCGTKCCDNIVAFYRLWYFWIFVLMLFVACSGGGFWLRRRRMGDDLRASLTSTSDDGFVRNLREYNRPRIVNVQRDQFSPVHHQEANQLPVQPPAYSDVAESKPPSYESLFRDQGQRGDNPSFQEEERHSEHNGESNHALDKAQGQMVVVVS